MSLNFLPKLDEFSTLQSTNSPEILIDKLHQLQKTTEELTELAKKHLSKISSLNYSKLPSIQSAITPAERNLLSA